MSDREILLENNAKIEEIRQTLARKQVSPTDMLQARVDATNSCYYLFYQFGGEDLSFIKNLDTSEVTDMSSMFQSCSKLTNIDLNNLNTSKVKTMLYMFSSCQALTSLNLSNFDTGNVTVMADMFSGCNRLTELDISNFNTSNVINMNYMFSQCNVLKSLDVSKFNTSKVTGMQYMFNSCTALTSLDVSNFDTSNVTSIIGMFFNCSNLTTLDLSSFNTSKISNMSRMFQGCNNLINIIGTIDMLRATSVSDFVGNCKALTNLTLKNIKTSIQLGSGTSWGTLLTNDTLINTIQELWDLTGSTSKTLTLSTTSKENIANIYVKLIDVTDEMLATDPYAANKKPCVVCEPTDEGAMTITEYAISKNWAIA